MYELDGNNEGPINLGSIDGGKGGFIRTAVKHLQKVYIKPFPVRHCRKELPSCALIHLLEW